MSLSDAEVARCLEAALELAEFATGRMSGERPGGVDVWTKSHAADWVTAVDLAIEAHVRDRLAAWFPGHGIVGEEYGLSEARDAGGPVWYCDPVDGTTNFVHGLPWSSFSLAVADDAGLCVGVVADPHRREVFSAVRGGGARVNAIPVTCATPESLVGGIVLSELEGTRVWDGMTEMELALSAKGCVTRVMGSSALALASVGAGRAAAAVFGAVHPIDVAAGLLVARESGASVRSASRVDPLLGTDGTLSRAAFVVCAPGVLDELLTTLR